MEKRVVPIKDRYTLTVNEASAYFNIGEKRIRRVLKTHPNQFTLRCGNRQLIVRHKFEEFIDKTIAL